MPEVSHADMEKLLIKKGFDPVRSKSGLKWFKPGPPNSVQWHFPHGKFDPVTANSILKMAGLTQEDLDVL